MNILPLISQSTDELTAIFRDLHAHPEIGFTEERTSAIVADKLRDYGVDEVHTGLGKTGVVGLIHGKRQGNRRVGLRADMDALPIHEITGLDYASRNDGVMHACGHDGHTTMLLGAAKHLAGTRDFDGTAVLVFQPAEEGLGGARQMIADGLFEQFPCDEIYGHAQHAQRAARQGRHLQGGRDGRGRVLRHHGDGQGQPCRAAQRRARRADHRGEPRDRVPDDPEPQRAAAGYLRAVGDAVARGCGL